MSEDWNQLLQMAEEVSAENISESSKSIYNSRIHVYETVLQKLQQNPYPISTESMKGFLMYQLQKGKKYNTLVGYISGFSHYFDQNSLPNLTKDIIFKNFKSGLRRRLLGNSCPNAKLPFDVSWFEKIANEFPLNQYDNRLFFLYMTLSFSGFLRISELLNLKKKDLQLSQDSQILTINISSSKTDQFGRGTKTFIYNNNTVFSPIQYLDVIDNLDENDIICKIKEHALRSHLSVILNKIGVTDFNSYCWHSFRRGGAYLCGINGTPDYVIKAHGRWKSHAYIRYVSVDMNVAGKEIAESLSKT